MSTLPSVARVDFTVLSSQFRLLPITPAWLQVSDAIARLNDSERNKISPPPSDPIIVRQFAENLRRNGPALGDALAIAIVMGQMSEKPTAGEKMIAGLSALARAYPLETLDEAGVADILSKVKQQLTDRFGNVSWSIPPLKDEASVAPWEEALNALRGQAANIPVDKPTRAGIADEAWKTWQKRLDARFRRNLTDPPTADELLNAASGLPPATLLRHALERMTVAEWTDALVQALWPDSAPASIPFWLARVAIHALGFRGVQSVAVIGPTQPERSETVAMVGEAWDWLGSGATSPPGVLIVRRDTKSALAAWLPSTAVPAISLSGADLDRLLESRSQHLSALLWNLKVGNVAIEMPADESRLSRWLSGWRPPAPTPYLPVPIFIYMDSATQRTRTPVVAEPKGLEELKDRLNKGPSAPPPA